MGLCVALIILSTQSTLCIGLLFSAVQEMISIMQDYGEVVCCVGSSFNSANPAIFTQADIR